MVSELIMEELNSKLFYSLKAEEKIINFILRSLPITINEMYCFCIVHKAHHFRLEIQFKKYLTK